jgi:hypothetical protein
MNSSSQAAPPVCSRWWGDVASGHCAAMPFMRPAGAVSAEHALAKAGVSRWLASPLGETGGDEIGSGGIFKQIEAMVGNWIPSSSPGEVHHRWYCRNMDKLRGSVRLAWRLYSASEGEVDLRGGQEWFIDAVTKEAVRVPFCAKNAFLPSVHDEKIFGFMRKLELFLAHGGENAEVITISITRTIHHRAAAAWLIDVALPAVRQSLDGIDEGGAYWNLVVWRRDHGRLKPVDGDVTVCTANWHLHLVLLPSSMLGGRDDRQHLRERIQQALKRVALPKGCSAHPQVHLSDRHTGDARRIASYICKANKVEDFDWISDDALLRFFQETQRLKRYAASGSFFDDRQRLWMTAEEQSELAAQKGERFLFRLGLKGIRKIHRYLKEDLKGWGYRVERMKKREDDDDGGDEEDDGCVVRTFVAAYLGERYSLMARVRTWSDEQPDIDLLAKSRPWLANQIEAAREKWGERIKSALLPGGIPPVTPPPGVVTEPAVAGLAPP